MSKDNLTQYSATNASNTDIGGVNIDEGMLPGDVNNAIREQMTHLKNFSDGTDAIDALAVDNLRLDGNTISSTNTNGDITLDPNGTGDVVVSSGIDVTGTVTADGLTVDSDNATATIKAFQPKFILDDDSAAGAGSDKLIIQSVSGQSDGDYEFVLNNDQTSSTDQTAIKIKGNGDIAFYDSTGVTQGLFWDASTQRLGLGTSSPSFPLTIEDSANHLYLKQSNQDNGWLINTADADGELHVSRRGEGASPSNNERLTISTAGNVGIGVAPETKLHVEGDVDALNDGNVMHIESNGDGGNRGINIGQEGDGSQARMFLQGYHSQSVTNYWDLLVNPFGGNVGIGTSSPDYLTEIEGNGGGDTVTLALTNLGPHPARLRLNSSHGNWSVGTSITAADALEFRDESASATRMTIDSGGDVGINQTQPGTEHTSGTVLQVKGGTANTKPAVVWLQGGSLDGAGSCCTEVFGVAGIQSATEISRLTMSGANGYRALIKVEATGHTSGKGNGHHIIQGYWDGGTSSVTTIYSYGGSGGNDARVTFDTSTSNTCIVKVNRGSNGTGADQFNGVVRIEWLIPVDFASSTGVVS